MINYKVEPILPGSLRLISLEAIEVREDKLQEKIQAGASEPDSPRVFSTALSCLKPRCLCVMPWFNESVSGADEASNKFFWIYYGSIFWEILFVSGY